MAIDDFSFNWTGYQWPWPRDYLAQIVDQVNAGGARVVGLDVFLFNQAPDSIQDEVLARALDESQNAVSTMQIFKPDDYQITLRLPLTLYQEALDGIGVAGIIRSGDAIVREIQVADFYDEQIYYNWAFEVARLYLGTEQPTDLTSTSIYLTIKKYHFHNLKCWSTTQARQKATHITLLPTWLMGLHWKRTRMSLP